MRTYRTKSGATKRYLPSTYPGWGKFISSHRERRGLNKSELAKLCQFDPSYISMMEIHNVVPRVKAIERIAHALNIPPAVAFSAAGYNGISSLPQ